MADAEVVFRERINLGASMPGPVDTSWVENRLVGTAELIVVRVLDMDPATVETTLPSVRGIICCENAIAPTATLEYSGGDMLVSTDVSGQTITITNAHNLVSDDTRINGGVGCWDRYCSLLVIS